MAYRYKFTPLAVADIDEALNYIAGNLSNPTAAWIFSTNKLHHSERQDALGFPPKASVILRRSEKMNYQVLTSTESLPYEDWLEYRKRGIGGSDSSVVYGVSVQR